MFNVFGFVSEIIAANEFFFSIIFSLLLFLAFWASKGLVVRLLHGSLCRLLNRKRQRIDPDGLRLILVPVKSLLVLTGLYLAVLNLLHHMDGTLVNTISFVTRSYRIGFLVIVAWMLMRVVDQVSPGLLQLNQKLDAQLNVKLNQTLTTVIQKLIKALVLCVLGIAILNEAGINVATIITGLGLGGLTFALAAQDTAANLFGGLVILFDRPFEVGDWIATPDLEGVVEDISFRSTRIRTFADSQTVVPNNKLTSSIITNWSRMSKRRASFSVGVTYDTPKEKLQSCVSRIDQYLRSNPDIDQENIVVNFNSFQDSSLEIALYFFTATTSMAAYRKVIESVNYAIWDILSDEGVEFAFPTQTIHIASQAQN